MPVLNFPRPRDALPCHVRVRTLRDDGFVEFDFSIGDPDLSVDLILPRAAYEEFCANNRVSFLTLEEGARIDADQAKWRYGLPGLTE